MALNVLIVDKEASTLTDLESMLTRKKFRVTRTQSPFEAITLLNKREYQVIISEQNLAYMGGTELLERVRHINPLITRVLSTAELDSKAALDAINRACVFRIINLPAQEECILQVVEEALQHHATTLRHAENRHRVDQQKEVYQDLIRKSVMRGQEIQQMNTELHRSYAVAVDTLAKLLKISNFGIWSHCRRVCSYAERLGQHMSLSREHQEQLEVAALLHDLGKWCLPPDLVRRKPESLKEKDRKTLQQHPVLGALLVANIDRYVPASLMIRHHQERFDGSGYPDGLSGTDIPLGARILGLLDAFDQLLHPGMGRTIPLEDVFAELEASGAYDPELLALWKSLSLPGQPRPIPVHDAHSQEWNRSLSEEVVISCTSRPVRRSAASASRPENPVVHSTSIPLDWMEGYAVERGPETFGFSPLSEPAGEVMETAQTATGEAQEAKAAPNVIPMPQPSESPRMLLHNMMPPTRRRRLREVRIGIENLRAGMVIARDIKNEAGVMLLPQDTVITPERCEQLRRFLGNHPLQNEIYVYEGSLLMIS